MRPSLLLVVLLSAFSSQVIGNGVIVHSIRRLRLSNSEPLPAKDFYINLGARDGVRVGDLFSVQRNTAVEDILGDGPVHVVPVNMGTLQVIAVGDSASIGREVPGLAPEALASVKYATFMVGDEVIPKTDLPSTLTIP